MKTFETQNTVGEVVRRRPSLSRVFEEEGIDYCCGGKKSLEDVCMPDMFASRSWVRNGPRSALW